MCTSRASHRRACACVPEAEERWLWPDPIMKRVEASDHHGCGGGVHAMQNGSLGCGSPWIFALEKNSTPTSPTSGTPRLSALLRLLQCRAWEHPTPVSTNPTPLPATPSPRPPSSHCGELPAVLQLHQPGNVEYVGAARHNGTPVGLSGGSGPAGSRGRGGGTDTKPSSLGNWLTKDFETSLIDQLREGNAELESLEHLCPKLLNRWLFTPWKGLKIPHRDFSLGHPWASNCLVLMIALTLFAPSKALQVCPGSQGKYHSLNLWDTVV